MGLDMYAARRLYVKQWEHQKPEERYSVQLTVGGKPVPGIQSDRISAVEEEVMYWRKANHIHKWFVDNVQDGNDNCAKYHVHWDKLQELLDVCEKVIESSELVDGMIYGGTLYDSEHPNGITRRVPGQVIVDSTVAEKLLPSRDGPFFGGCEYDGYYLDNVVQTRDWAARMLADSKAGVPGSIYYSSSW